MAHHEHFRLIPIDIADDPDQPLIDNGNRLHCQWQKMNIRIPAAPNPHEELLLQRLLTFLRQYGSRGYGKIAQTLVLIGFFELAQSGGAEQNSVSIALEPSSGATFFNR